MAATSQSIATTCGSAPMGAPSIVIGSTPPAGVLQGFVSWKDRSHAVTGAEGSSQDRIT